MSTQTKNKVIIVGGGIGGAMLACLFEKNGTPYEILERGDTVTFLGTAVALSAGALAVMEQLGLLEKFEAISKPMTSIDVNLCDENDKITKMGGMDYTQYKPKSGHHWGIVGRYELHQLLISQLPTNKMRLNKKVISVEHSETDVTVRCMDGSSYTGTIVVGADGNSSVVRSEMHSYLKQHNKLSKHDATKAPFSSVAVIGLTQPLDPKEFPDVVSDTCVFDNVLKSGTEWVWTTYTTPSDRVSWFIWENTKYCSESKRQALVDGRQNVIDDMCKVGKEFPTTLGPKLGRLMENTRPQDFTKVIIEEKVYDTWYARRMVCMGDAVHKCHPAGGLNANHSIMDAVSIANVLYELDSSAESEITKAFECYHNYRYPLAKEVYLESNLFGSLFLCQSLSDRMWVKALVHWLPTVAYQLVCDRLVQSRPQAVFLPKVADRGTVKPRPQMAAWNAKKNATIAV